MTKPTTINIPKAINDKILYIDTAFFCFFARTKNSTPKHQQEFESLFKMAIEKYKHYYDVRFINKKNKQQLYDKLKIKITIDFIFIGLWLDHTTVWDTSTTAST